MLASQLQWKLFRVPMFEDFILSSYVSRICTHSSTWIDLMLVIMFGQNPSCWTWKPLSISFGQIPGCRIWKPLDLWQSLAWNQSLLNQSHDSIDLFKSLEVFFPTMRKAEWAKEFGKQARQVRTLDSKVFLLFCCCWTLLPPHIVTWAWNFCKRRSMVWSKASFEEVRLCSNNLGPGFL